MAGLKTLYDGTKEASGLTGPVDIIAVHGFGANPDFAWIRKKQPEEGQFEDINWLETFLPRSLPASRIRCFTYDSRWLGKNLPKQCLTNIAEQLLDALFHSTSDPGWPVIFIGHSFGGLVIEQALLLANSDSTKYQTILRLTAGVIFLGTPHRGSAAQPWGELAAKCAITLGFPAEKDLLNVLSEESVALYELVHQFTAIVGRRSIPVKCFFELYKTPLGRRIPWSGSLNWLGNADTMIVDRSSGTIPGLDHLALETDHFKINKFGRLDDPTYISVSNCVIGFAKEAINLVQSRSGAHAKSKSHDDFTPEERACLGALFLTEPKDDRTKLTNDKGERVSGTCEWITTHEKYLQWLRDPVSQLLWISGGPGKGKTMLSIFLTEELNSQTERSHDAVLAYYFCDNKDANRRTGITILRALILQILRQRPSLFQHILPDFEVQKETLFTTSSAQEALWRVLRSMLLDSNSTKTITYLVIDGLDECEQPSLNIFLKECRTIFSHLDSNKFDGACKLILISRDLPGCIPEALADYDRIRLDPDSELQVNRDLHRFIFDRVQKLARRKSYPEELRKLLEQRLLERCDGRFLWVAFVIGELENKSAAEVLDTLESIPLGLHDVYDRLLLQIQKSRREIASRILGWIVMAVRPLKLAELAEATGCQSSGKLSPHEVIRYQVEYCGALVQITGPEDEVGLIHQSVKDHLLREHPDSDAQLDIFRIDQGNLNAEITNTCLKYMHNCLLAKSHVKIWEGDYRSLHQSSLEEFPFLTYVILYWPEHAQHSSGYDFSLPFFDESSPIREAWLETYWALEYNRVQPKPPPTLLHLAAKFGLFSLAERLLSGGIRKSLYAFRYINKTFEFDYQGSTMPLECAAERGHEGLVRLLLKNRAKINFKRQGIVCSPALRIAATHGHVGIAQLLLKSNAYVHSVEQRNRSFRTPLAAASANGHEEMVRLLLQAGAHVNPKAKSRALAHDSALWYASGRGDTSIVRLLLENGADVNSKNKDDESALMRASSEGHESIVRLLLEDGADINYCFGRFALMRASHTGHESTVQLLLENGADIDSKDDRNNTALMQASMNGHEPTVRLLLENGADINCKDCFGRFALMEASCYGHESTVRLLLENGADIECKDRFGQSALIKASYWGYESTVRLLVENGADIDSKDGRNNTALMQASLKGRESTIRLLLENGADINCKGRLGRSALMKASCEGHESTVRLLLENGADINCKNENDQSALMEASGNGHESTIRLLLENGADIDSKNEDGESALMIASLYGYESTVRLLLKNGADINCKNDENNTALMQASLNGSESTVRLLLENGADINCKNDENNTALMLALLNWNEQNIKDRCRWPADKEKYSALMHASYNFIVRLLLKRGADINVENNDGFTALTLALRNNNDEIVRLLQEHEGTE